MRIVDSWQVSLVPTEFGWTEAEGNNLPPKTYPFSIFPFSFFFFPFQPFNRFFVPYSLLLLSLSFRDLPRSLARAALVVQRNATQRSGWIPLAQAHLARPTTNLYKTLSLPHPSLLALTLVVSPAPQSHLQLVVSHSIHQHLNPNRHLQMVT